MPLKQRLFAPILYTVRRLGIVMPAAIDEPDMTRLGEAAGFPTICQPDVPLTQLLRHGVGEVVAPARIDCLGVHIPMHHFGEDSPGKLVSRHSQNCSPSRPARRTLRLGSGRY